MAEQRLLIRPAQMVILRKDADKRFFEGLQDNFARLYPDTQDMPARISGAILRAKTYELTSDQDLEWFIELDLQRGREWERAPEMSGALEILDNPGVDSVGRRFRLEKWLRRWDAASL